VVGTGEDAEVSAAPRYAWVDGRLADAGGPVISVFDRGFTLGDGVFETIHALGGHLADLQAHLDRLSRSAELVGIPLEPAALAQLASAAADVLHAEGLAGPGVRASVRLTITRGAPPDRGLLPSAPPAPTMVVQAWPAPPPDPGLLERGVALVASAIRHDPESPLAGVKATSRLDHVVARLEARRAGADDALFLTPDGYLAEATSANLFIVSGSELATPALACGILAGTVRAWTLAWASRVGLTTVETLISGRALLEADEAFLTSSVAGVVPVTRYEGRPIGDGLPGPWSRRARTDREDAEQASER
jgi:branched-subunit amino acid aminotransferase/4-amino-4-deoxychorismate lyase